MKRDFPMRGTGERDVRCRVFMSSKRKLQPICIVIAFWLSAVIGLPAQTLTTVTTVGTFNGTNGANPIFTALIQGNDGNLYGTTRNGGINNNNAGTIFKIDRTTGVLTTLYTFCPQGGGCADGRYPFSGLVLANDGNFYGTTSGGGSTLTGTVFKFVLNAQGDGGTLTTLYSFCTPDCTHGYFPLAPLVQGRDGNLYGTTALGGLHGDFGTVFKLTPNGSGWTFTSIYSFTGIAGIDGSFPVAALVQGMDGNFYGTTELGGDDGKGTLFKISSAGSLNNLYNFTGSADGAQPLGALVQDPVDESFYGTNPYGGSNCVGDGGCGTVFQFIPNHQGTGGTLNPLHEFCSQGGNNCADGANPNAGLVLASDGNFYGTTDAGGAFGPYGTIFQITPAGALSNVYGFCLQSGCQDGAAPDGALVQSRIDGNLYGVNATGGSNGDGTVFRLSATLGSYTLTVSPTGSGNVASTDGHINCPDRNMCSFLYPIGTQVMLAATPTQGSESTFGGWSGGGCTGMDPCTVTMTQNLSVAAPFIQPTPILTVAIAGSGTVSSRPTGINCPGVCGYSFPLNTVVTLTATPNPQGWTFMGQGAGWGGACSGHGSCTVTMAEAQTVTATFVQIQGSMLSVSTSGSGLVTSTDGVINCPGTCSNTYPVNTHVTLNATGTQGATFTGWSGACSGISPCNLIMAQNLAVTATFSVTPQAMLIHSFGMGDGMSPSASLMPDTAGNFYGTTFGGGLSMKGRSFMLSPNGSGGYRETELYDFTGNGDGQNPAGSLIRDSAGNLYGTTSAGGVYGGGTVFELKPNALGIYTEMVLYNFGSYGGDGLNPMGNLIFDSGGNLYGTTALGGSSSKGTVFKLSPNGSGFSESVLFRFGNCSDGVNPYAGLVLDDSGNLYGTTYGGGTFGYGTVFELSPNGGGCSAETVLYSFANTDGANPYAGLIFDGSGNLYGTTVSGGTNNNGGTVFELSPPSGGGNWTETGLYSFGSGSDGVHPYAGLVFDNSGDLYGTTLNGGMYHNGGTVFELAPNAAAPNRCCREVMRYSFGMGNGNYGQNPMGGVAIDGSGNMLGTTSFGGLNGSGTVFAMIPASQFVATTPCRVVDTRQTGGPIQGGTSRDFSIPQLGGCGIPSTAIAYSLNVTVAPHEPLGYLTIWPTGQPQPLVSTLNAPDGRTKANAAIVPAGNSLGAVSVYVTDTTDVILDIDGYFTAPGSQTLQFYPLPPCRLVDTRNPDGPLGGPRLPAQQERDFPLLASSCIPAGVNPAAYSLNFTAVPNPSHQHLGYLTVWPTGQVQPTVSTLNNPTGTVVANAAIVPAGQNGKVAVWAYDTTDLLIDVNGYFAPPGQGGYSFYVATPCRAYDSRNNNGQPFSGERIVNIVNGPCAPPSNATGYVFNATVVPNHRLGYLTLWPDGEEQPPVSTLNAYDGFVTSNMAIVPNVNGSIDAYAGDGSTQLILDISGYFAP